MPQLLIVDGGTGQLNVAMEVLDELDVSGVDVIGVVKPRTHRKRGDMDMPDRIVSPDLIEPVQLSKGDPVLLFLQRIRDEITIIQRYLIKRNSERSIIPVLIWMMFQVWVQKRRKLLVHFGSVKAIANASPEDLMQVSGVGESMAERIVEHFSRLDKR